jgi:hypothetical protein
MKAQTYVVEEQPDGKDKFYLVDISLDGVHTDEQGKRIATYSIENGREIDVMRIKERNGR